MDDADGDLGPCGGATKTEEEVRSGVKQDWARITRGRGGTAGTQLGPVGRHSPTEVMKIN